MTSFIFSKAVQQAGLESLWGRFWLPAFMFDTPALYKHSMLAPLKLGQKGNNKSLWLKL